MNALPATAATPLNSAAKEDPVDRKVVKADKRVVADKDLEAVKAVRVVKEAALDASADKEAKEAMMIAESASKASATKPKITCCNACANPIPRSVSPLREVLAVPAAAVVSAVVSAVITTEPVADSVVAIITKVVLMAVSAKEENNSCSKPAKITKATLIKRKPV